MVAKTVAEYVEKAVAIGRNRELEKSLRKEILKKVEEKEFFQNKRSALNWEKAFEKMIWRKIIEKEEDGFNWEEKYKWESEKLDEKYWNSSLRPALELSRNNIGLKSEL